MSQRRVSDWITTDDTEGYKAPIHLALTRVFTIGGVQRELLYGWGMFCLGAGMAFRSWGAIPLYIVGHALMAYLTWRDDRWPYILRESIRYRVKLR